MKKLRTSVVAVSVVAMTSLVGCNKIKRLMQSPAPQEAPAPSPSTLPSPTPAASPSPSAQMPLMQMDLVRQKAPEGAKLSGFGEPEQNSNSQWRWLEGPEAHVSFELPSAGELELEYAFSGPIAAQEVSVQWNGKTVAAFSGQGPVTNKVPLSAQAGTNELAFKFSSWNHGKTTFAPQDARKLAIIAQKLSLKN